MTRRPEFFGVIDAAGNVWYDAGDWTPGQHTLTAQLENITDEAKAKGVTYWLDGTTLHAASEQPHPDDKEQQ